MNAASNPEQCPALYFYGGHWVQCILLEGHAYPGHFNADVSWCRK